MYSSSWAYVLGLGYSYFYSSRHDSRIYILGAAFMGSLIVWPFFSCGPLPLRDVSYTVFFLDAASFLLFESAGTFVFDWLFEDLVSFVTNNLLPSIPGGFNFALFPSFLFSSN